MFKGSILCGIIFLLWVYSFSYSIVSIVITCSLTFLTHYITKHYLNGWLITNKIDGIHAFSDGRGEKDENEEKREKVFPSTSSICQDDNFTIKSGVNGQLKKGIIVKRSGLSSEWMITCLDFIIYLGANTIYLISVIKNSFNPTPASPSSSSNSHGTQSIGSSNSEDVTGKGGATRKPLIAADLHVNEVVMKLPSRLVNRRPIPSASSRLSTLDSIVKELINDYILIWFQTIHSDTSSLTSCDFVKDCHSLLSSIFTQIINDHITRLSFNRIYHKFVDVIIHHFEDEVTSKSRRPEKIGLIEANHDYTSPSSSHYNNWMINQSEPTQSIDEEIIARLDNFLDMLLSSVTPDALIDLKLIKCDDLQSRDSLYLMAKEILLFGVTIPVVNIVSEPDFVNSTIYKVASKYITQSQRLETMSIDQCKSLRSPNYNNVHWNSSSVVSSTPKSRLIRRKLDKSPSPISRSNSEYFPVPREFQLNLILKEVIIHLIGRNMQSLASRDDSFVERYSGLETGLDIDNEQFSRIRLFSNIRIPEAHEAGSRGDKFILYTIVYDGLFEEVETAGINKATVSCLVRKQVTVYRRFSEFLILHSKLNQNRNIRPFLRRIRDPSKLKSYSVFKSKVGKSLTDVRKSFLTLYLNEMASIDVLENSYEFREFLSYEAADGPVNFMSGIVKDISSLIIPLRIDKAIVGGFKGAVSLIKTVFPIEPVTEDSCFFPGTGFGTSHFQMEYSVIEEKLILENILDNIGEDDVISQIRDDFSQANSIDESCQLCESAAGALLQEHSSSVSTSMPQLQYSLIDSLNLHLAEIFPLATPSIDFIFFLRNLKFKISFLALTCKLLFGNLIELLLQRQATKLLVEDNLTLVLELLHESIWPSVNLDDCDIDVMHLDGRTRGRCPSSKKVEELLIKLCENNITFFKHLLNEPKNLVPFIISKLQNHESNKILVYDLLDVIHQEMKHSE